MASSPVTAPSSDSDSPPVPPTSKSPPPPDGDSSSSPPPPSDDSPSPPPPSPNDSSSPPPPSSDDSSSPPPPPQTPPSQSPPTKQSSPPPPSQSSNNPSPPPPQESDSPPSGSSPPPPPSGNSSPPPSSGGSSSSSPPPPPTSTMTPPSGPSKSHTPPPPKALSPPSHKHAPPHSKEDSEAPTNHQSDLNVPLVVGITVGVGVFIVLMVVAFVCRTNKKKKRPHDAMRYYGDPSNGGSRVPKGGDYYSGGQNWHGMPQSMDHVVKVPPPPGLMGSMGGGWNPPPLPVTTMSSSDMSSGYSGPHGPALPPPSPNIALGFNKSTFSYDELAAATSGFSQANLLGQGGFGYVHKGVLPNGKEIAVKQLKAGSGQGEREFQAEVEIISRVHHRHLVSLVGYCIAGEQRMLVYEFVPNKTLEFHLYGKDRPVMDFPTRLKIALGSAKGLAYLHEDCHPRIIHRDIKAANILLDYEFEAMVADFGLAKLSSDNYTHVSTRVMGTFGYLAPEYASSGKLTEKSDVFSFGIMLLELITGRRPVDNSTYMEDSLVDWARPLLAQSLNDGNYDELELADPRLEGNYSPNEMARLVACAAASVRHSARKRPKMSQIVRALEGDSSLEDLNEGVKPGHGTIFGSSESSEYDTSSYHSDMRKFQKVALASQEFSSGEQGASREMNSTGYQRHGL